MLKINLEKENRKDVILECVVCGLEISGVLQKMQKFIFRLVTVGRLFYFRMKGNRFNESGLASPNRGKLM